MPSNEHGLKRKLNDKICDESFIINNSVESDSESDFWVDDLGVNCGVPQATCFTIVLS